MEIIIRPATADDAPAIVELVVELAQSGGEVSPLTAGYVSTFLDSPINHLLLAETESQAVGLLSYFIRPDLFHGEQTCQIQELVVRSGFRDRGIGGLLIDAAMQCAAGLGCAEISVTTDKDNQGAQRFYRNHGFDYEAVYLEKHFNKEPEPAS
jgi:ribosomal protein S18 acetylase RimI-like enzyme